MPQPFKTPPGIPPTLSGFGSIAVDATGDLYVSTTYTGWSVYEVLPNGQADDLGYARRSGGNTATVQLGPGNAAEADSGNVILRAEGGRLVPSYTFPNSFFLTYFAYGPGGVLYADEIGGTHAFEPVQEIVSVRAGNLRVLWRHRNT